MTGIVLMGLLMLSMYFLPKETLIDPDCQTACPGADLHDQHPADAGGGFVGADQRQLAADGGGYDRQRKVGTYTGLYYLFSTLAAIAGPNINGWIVASDRKQLWAGDDHRADLYGDRPG